jgi:hypothetical protein
VGVVDVRAQRVQRHPALAIPLGPRDLGAAQTAGGVDADALRAQTHGVLHRALERAAEADAALELLGDVLATSCASISGLRISTMLRCSSLSVSLATFWRSFSMSAPFLPMITPGRAVWIVTRHLRCGRSITTRETPACAHCS